MANPVATRAVSYVATVVAIATDDLVDETSSALEDLQKASAVRTILVTLGDDPQPSVDRQEDATVIRGLLPRFVDNAVAALRLSSLPSLAWWRRPEAHLLRDVAHLVDRILLDVPEPAAGWQQARELREVTSFGDIRWTRLTRWRSLMAQFFDLPDVQAEAARFARLEITADDQPAARLFAAWMRSRLPRGNDLAVSILPGGGSGGSMTAVTLHGEAQRLGLRLLANRTCVETLIARADGAETIRVVPFGRTSPVAMLTEEMRVRSRDLAFEEALTGVEGI